MKMDKRMDGGDGSWVDWELEGEIGESKIESVEIEMVSGTLASFVIVFIHKSSCEKATLHVLLSVGLSVCRSIGLSVC